MIKIKELKGSIKELESSIEDRNNKIKEMQEENYKLIEEVVENEKWLKIKDDEIIRLEGELKEIKDKWDEKGMSIPVGASGFKSYMDYRCIGEGSEQGKIVYGDEAWTDGNGLRKEGEYYCVALGSYYGEIGDKFLVETDKGNKYKIIKADEKANKHTDASNRYTLSNGCMMEWIVDTNKLSSFVRKSGNIDNVKKVSGSITKLAKIKG